MTILTINGHQSDIDIEGELRQYNFGYNARWTPTKLVASSPFRSDNAPSFFVNLDGEYAGTWADSGALDYEYMRGGFVKLIGLLRGITTDEAAEYLLEKYGTLYEIKLDEPIRIAPPKLRRIAYVKPLEYNPIVEATSPYLLTRGISEEVQTLYGVGYDEAQPGFTAIPWRTEGGKVANIMYRSTRGKYFFYYDGGTPIKRLLFGIDKAEETAALVEAPIDAMSWTVAGISGVAVGGAYMSVEQAEIIKRSRIRKLLLGGDNDDQGRKLNEQARRMLRGYVEMATVDYGEYKDANDVLKSEGADILTELEYFSNRVSTLKRLQLL